MRGGPTVSQREDKNGLQDRGSVTSLINIIMFHERNKPWKRGVQKVTYAHRRAYYSSKSFKRFSLNTVAYLLDQVLKVQWPVWCCAHQAQLLSPQVHEPRHWNAVSVARFCRWTWGVLLISDLQRPIHWQITGAIVSLKERLSPGSNSVRRNAHFASITAAWV